MKTRSTGAPALVETIIQPSGSLVRFNWREFFEHRDLLWLLARREIVAKYKQTILGPLWHVVQPLMMAAVFTMVFTRVIAVSSEGVPRILFYLAGLLGWNYFSQNISATSGTFTTNAALFSKVYFPRLHVPLANVLSNLVAMGLQLGVFLILFAGYKLLPSDIHGEIGWTILLLPLLVLQTAALSLGLGLCLSCLTAKYRDLQHAMPFLISIWMFLTPVIYPISEISAGSRWIFLLNPMGPIVESFRRILLGVGTVHPGALGLSIFISISVLLIGMAMFERTARTVVDTV